MSLRRHKSKGSTTSTTTTTTPVRCANGTRRQWGAWPPASGAGGTGASRGGARGGSLNALDLLDDVDERSDWPQTEAELVEHYQSSIMMEQQRHLEPLREDLADWLNKILGKSNHFNFFFLFLL